MILAGSIYFSFPNANAIESKNIQQCGISLKTISTKKGKPGDIIKLFGKWGKTQDEKRPVINKGRANDLEVIFWSKTVIKVKILENLEAGNYRVGVYCINPTKAKGLFQSTMFMDFEIINSIRKL